MWDPDETKTTVSAIITAAIIVFAIALVISLLAAFPIMWLWNWLMPVIFNLPTITVWQALGLDILFGLLFGGRVSTSSTNRK